MILFLSPWQESGAKDQRGKSFSRLEIKLYLKRKEKKIRHWKINGLFTSASPPFCLGKKAVSRSLHMMVILGYRALALKRWWLTLSAVKVYIPWLEHCAYESFFPLFKCLPWFPGPCSTGGGSFRERFLKISAETDKKNCFRVPWNRSKSGN